MPRRPRTALGARPRTPATPKNGWRAACRVVLALALTATVAQAREPDQIPPATAQPLSAIVRSIEAEGHTVIPEIAFDDEVWKLRVYKAGLEYEIQVDPVSAEILSIRPVQSPKRATR